MESEDDDILVKAQIQNTKILQQFLKAIHFKDDANVTISTNGLKLTVEDSKTFQASAIIQKEVFRTFDLHADVKDDIQFQLSLPPLIDCLGMFGHNNGANPVLYLQYTDGDPLKLWMEESGVIIEINAMTKETQEQIEFDFDNSDTVCRVIIQSEMMKEILNDLDTSSDSLELSANPDEQVLKLSTSGVIGRLDIEIPKDSEMVHSFSSTKFTLAKYPMALIRHSLRPLSMSEKVSIRVNSQDILCLQYMIKIDDLKSFVEYKCIPEDDM